MGGTTQANAESYYKNIVVTRKKPAPVAVMAICGKAVFIAGKCFTKVHRNAAVRTNHFRKHFAAPHYVSFTLKSIVIYIYIL